MADQEHESPLSSEGPVFDMDDEGASHGRPLLKMLLFVVLLFGGGAGAAWYFYGAQMLGTSSDGVPIVRAKVEPFKTRPKDPGGMAIPNRDKLVYGRLDGEGEGQVVERLLPPPETPITPPQELTEALPSEMDDVKTQETVALSATENPQTPPPAPETTEQEASAPPAPPPPAPAPTETVKPAPPLPPTPAPSATTVEPQSSAATPAPVSPTAMSSAPSADAMMVQLGSVRSQAVANSEWQRLQKTHSAVLSGLEPHIQRADLGTKGVFYRIRAGYLPNVDAAKALCAKLTALNVGCIAVRP